MTFLFEDNYAEEIRAAREEGAFISIEELRVEVVDVDHTATDPEALKERFNR